jgi:hypothetical protein
MRSFSASPQRLDRLATLFGASSALALVALVSARSVRASAPAGRYAPGAGTGTVLDTKTGLTWQAQVPSAKTTWPNAYEYCQSLSLGGLSSGWRLPSVGELLTLIDDSRWDPAIDITQFPNTPFDAYYWTSSQTSVGDLSGMNLGWTVDFGIGLTGFYYTAQQAYQQAVASGASLTAAELQQLQSLRVRCVHGP